MNHRPFEDWLLDDQPLNPQQKRDLQTHLRICSSCSAIAESNLALRITQMLPPVAGFAERFQLRLETRRREQRWRQIIGTVVLVLGGLGLLYWLAGPLIEEALLSPAAWITTAVGYFLFIITSIQVLSEVGVILLRVLPTFVSPTGWLAISALFAGLSLLWTVSMLRVASAPQGV
jgi:hypothetical protein